MELVLLLVYNCFVIGLEFYFPNFPLHFTFEIYAEPPPRTILSSFPYKIVLGVCILCDGGKKLWGSFSTLCCTDFLWLFCALRSLDIQLLGFLEVAVVRRKSLQVVIHLCFVLYRCDQLGKWGGQAETNYLMYKNQERRLLGITRNKQAHFPFLHQLSSFNFLVLFFLNAVMYVIHCASCVLRHFIISFCKISLLSLLRLCSN